MNKKVLKNNLPEFVSFANIELAIVVAQLVASKSKRKVCGNVTIGNEDIPVFAEIMDASVEACNVTLRISKEHISRYCDHRMNGVPFIKTLKGAYEFFFEDELLVDGQPVVYGEIGAVIKGSLVTWKQLEEIISRKP